MADDIWPIQQMGKCDTEQLQVLNTKALTLKWKEYSVCQIHCFMSMSLTWPARQPTTASSVTQACM